jgi:hypothetical protein
VNARPVPPRRLWWLVAGFAVWCSALGALYGLHAIGCAFGWPLGQLRLGLSAAFLAHVVAIGWMWRHLARADSNPAFGHTASFLHLVSLWTVVAAFVAALFTFGSPLLLTMCL